VEFILLCEQVLFQIVHIVIDIVRKILDRIQLSVHFLHGLPVFYGSQHRLAFFLIQFEFFLVFTQLALFVIEPLVDLELILHFLELD
jgi:hypothetical protein